MTVNAAYRCIHGTVRTLVTMSILGKIIGKMGTWRIKLSITVNYVHIHIYRVILII